VVSRGDFGAPTNFCSHLKERRSSPAQGFDRADFGMVMIFARSDSTSIPQLVVFFHYTHAKAKSTRTMSTESVETLNCQTFGVSD
jgi:hypothetical protein